MVLSSASGPRRILRSLLQLLTAFSFLLCLAVVVLWVRGGFVEHELRFGRGNDDYNIPLGWEVWLGSGSGVVWVSYSADWVAQPSVKIPMDAGWFRHDARPPGTHSYRRWLRQSFRWGGGSGERAQFIRRLGAGRMGSSLRYVRVPHWSLVIVLGAGPAAWMVRRRLREQLRRRSAGLCAACGYDLRATPGRCPECGKVQLDQPDECSMRG